MDNNTKNESTTGSTVPTKAKGYHVAQVGRMKVQRKGRFTNLMRSITSNELMLFIISLVMILLGAYILFKPQFAKSTLIDIVDEKVEAELYAVERTIKDMRLKMQSFQEDRARLEMLTTKLNESLLALENTAHHNITQLELKLEQIEAKIQLQDRALKELEEEGRLTHESLGKFINTTRDNISEILNQQLRLQESIENVNESVTILAHATHNNITVQHNSTSKLNERMEQAEKKVEKFSASAEHLQRIDRKVAQLVSSGSIPVPSLIIFTLPFHLL